MLDRINKEETYAEIRAGGGGDRWQALSHASRKIEQNSSRPQLLLKYHPIACTAP